MKEMAKKLKEEREGFTLAELLIVVAIIGVLVAIAVPIFTTGLNKAEVAVNDANKRSARAEATVEWFDAGQPAGSTIYQISYNDKGEQQECTKVDNAATSSTYAYSYNVTVSKEGVSVGNNIGTKGEPSA